MLDDVTIIIPVGPNETAWNELLADLASVPLTAEVLLLGVDPAPAELLQNGDARQHLAVRWIQSAAGRARQMNRGATAASRQFLWFLHADSRINTIAIERLQDALRKIPEAMHYFQLAFQPDGPRLSRLNAWGANLRSRLLHLPFGDQGLCLSKESWCRLGGFDELLAHGEDHAFVWNAHRNRIALRPVPAQIATSARKYSRDGWLRTTCLHLLRTATQAAPQLTRLIMDREGA